MRREWLTIEGVDPPILLPNRDKRVFMPSNDAAKAVRTEAETFSVTNSIGGATKLTSIAGGLFNHNNNKKGHHFRWRAFRGRKTGQGKNFPNVSNTR